MKTRNVIFPITLILLFVCLVGCNPEAQPPSSSSNEETSKALVLYQVQMVDGSREWEQEITDVVVVESIVALFQPEHLTEGNVINPDGGSPLFFEYHHNDMLTIYACRPRSIFSGLSPVAVDGKQYWWSEDTAKAMEQLLDDLNINYSG